MAKITCKKLVNFIEKAENKIFKAAEFLKTESSGFIVRNIFLFLSRLNKFLNILKSIIVIYKPKPYF